MAERQYIAIDLKSFYASVECVERGLDPLTANLVVADESRTEKTICLAVSPSLKAYGIPGRARLFEVVQKIKEVNNKRKRNSPNYTFNGESYDDLCLKNDMSLAVSYIVAQPRMAYYMEYSTRIYNIYLKYISPDDIHVYSIDEVFIDVTNYLGTYKITARELAEKMIHDVLETTGITATAGIGTNLYLCKIAMDIVAKHIPADKNGVRIAELDEMSYRRLLWGHTPLTDFWRVGKGYASKLEAIGLKTMGDIARFSLNSEYLHEIFGVNAELLIDHAWGYEPCTIADIKAYRPSTKSISSGQVFQCPKNFDETSLIIKEMADGLSLDLVQKGIVTNQIGLSIGYDVENLKNGSTWKKYNGEIQTDRYGRKIPKGANSTINLDKYTASTKHIIEAALALYGKIADHTLLVRRLSIVANHVIYEKDIPNEQEVRQLDFFTDYAAEEKAAQLEKEELEREKSRQKAILAIKNKYGKNAIVRGMNLQEGATAMERNKQIGGHKA